MVLTAGVYPTIHCYPQLDWTSVKDQSLWYSVTHRVNMITLLMSGTLIPFCRMSPFRQPWRNLSRPLSLTIPYINGVVHHSWSCGQDQSWRVSWPTKHPLAVFYHINLSGWHCMDYSVVQLLTVLHTWPNSGKARQGHNTFYWWRRFIILDHVVKINPSVIYWPH